jgi:hypothetical protein
VQLAPTLTMEWTWIDAGADGVRGVRTPFRSTEWPGSLSADIRIAGFWSKISLAQAVGVLITRAVPPFCTHPE